MENLLKDFKDKKSLQLFDEIVKYIKENPLESYISKLSELISLSLSDKQIQPDNKFPLFSYIIDLFIEQKIPIDKLHSLSLERLLSTDYQINSFSEKKKSMEQFFIKQYYPYDQEFLDEIFSKESKGKEYEIDYLYSNFNNDTSTNLYYWLRAYFSIHPSLTNSFQIKYGNETFIHNGSSKGDGLTFKIAKCGKFTNDYEWRNNLKEGDIVSIGIKNVFYDCVILQRNGEYIQVKICNDKIYENNIFSEYIFHPYLRRKGEFQKFSRDNQLIDKNGSISEYEFILPEQFNEYENKLFIIPRELNKKQGNMFFIKLGNYFFEKFNSVFSFEESEKWFNVDKISYLLVFNEFLCNLIPYISFKVGKIFILKYYDMVLNILLSFSNNKNSKNMFKSFNKINIINFFNQLNTIMSYYMIKEDFDYSFSDFGFQFGLNCYNNSEVLEEKILGLNIITKCLSEHFNENINKNCILVNNEPNILTLLFEKNAHSQLIKMSYDILIELFKHKLITKEHLTQIFSYFKGDNEEIKEVVKKVFANFDKGVDNQLLILTIETFSREVNENDEKDIDILTEMAKKAPKEVFMQISDELIDKLYYIIIKGKESSKSMIEKFNDLIKIDDDNDVVKENYLKYINKLINDMINPNYDLAICVQFLNALLLRTPIFLDRDEDFKDKVTKILLIDNDLYSIIIDYFKSGKFDNTVFEFLSFIMMRTLKNSDLGIDIVKKLYYFFSKSENFNKYLNWISNILNQEIIQSSSLTFLFEDEYINSIELEKGIDDELYCFYWKLFQNINKIEEPNKIEQKYSGVTEDGKILTSYSYNPDKKSNKIVNLKEGEIYNPFEMKYFDIIWRLLIHLNENSFQKNAISFFDLFSVQGITLKNRRELWYNLIEKCMLKLSLNNNNLEMINSINLLKLLIEESERKGTAGLISHIGSLESHNISLTFHNIIHTSYYPLNKDENKKKENNDFTLTLKSNLSIWDLKKILSKKINVIPECIKLILYEDIEITDRDNGKLLSEKFIEGTKINIAKSNILEDIPKVALIKDGDLSEKAKKVLSEIFDMYSSDGKMNREQCAQFACRAVDSNEPIPPEDQRVKVLFDKYDTDKDEFLDVNGFFQFFIESILIDKKVSTVWDNIKAFDYRYDLKKLNEPLDDYNNDCDYQIMPRYILSNEQKFFDIIFNIQTNQNNDERLRNDANHLINMICTNNKFKNIVDNLDLEWEKFLKEENNDYMIFYMFQILESKIENYKNDNCNVENEKWIKKFLDEKNGFEYFAKEKFLKWDNNNNDNMKNLIYWCMLKIVLSCLEILFNSEKYFEYFNIGKYIIEEKIHNNEQIHEDKLNNKKKEEIKEEDKKEEKKEEEDNKEEKKEEEDNKEEKKEEKQEEKKEEDKKEDIKENENKRNIEQKQIDISKYPIKEILDHIINLIDGIILKNYSPQNQNYFNITNYQDTFLKLSLNILVLICIYNNDSLGIDNEKLSSYLNFLFINNEKIQKMFYVFFSILYKNLDDNNPIKKIIFTKVNEHVLDVETLQKSFFIYIIPLFENILIVSTSSFTNEEKIDYITKMLKIDSDYLLPHFLRSINIVINTLNKEEKIKICKEPLSILDKLINKYLLEDLTNEFIFPDTYIILFNIIHSLTLNCPENLIKFFENEKIQNIFNYLTPLKDGKDYYNPSCSSRTMSIPYIGIINLRNICYLISIIQQFFNISSFRTGLINARDNLEKKPDENIDDDNTLHQLQKLFTFLQYSRRNAVNPKDFVYSFKDLDNQPTDINVQCDAQEFLSRFMDKIEYSLSKTKYKYLMKSIFTGETCSQLICTNGCNTIRNRFEELLFLSLEMRNMNKIEQCLDKYIAEEIIDDFFCEKCNKKTRHIKRISINKLPNVLFVHLQRFSFNYETFLMEKINSTLEFPRQINLKKFCSETININNENLKDDIEFNTKVYNHSDEYYNYELKGVVVHSGTAQFGHYYSFINTQMSDINDNSWLRFDDSLVTNYNSNKLQDDTFGGDPKNEKGNDFFQRKGTWEEASKSAYMLVYERKFKSPIMKLVDKDSVDNNNIIDIGDNYDTFYKSVDPFIIENKGKNQIFLDCEYTAISRNNNLKYKNDNIYKYKEEYFKLIPYYAFSFQNLNLNKEYFNEVLRDNIMFRNDINIYNENFVNFISYLTKNLVSQIEESSDKFSDDNLLKIVKAIHHILVDILTKIYEKDNINNIIIEMIQIVRLKPFISKIILEEFLKDKNYYISKLILTLDDKLNTPFQNYLSESIRYALTYDTEAYTSLVNETIDYLLSLIPLEISKTWTKMISYLDIFDTLLNMNIKLTNLHNKIVKIFFEKDIISKFGDFFLGKESPLLKSGESRNEIGNKTVNAKFAPLIGVISTLSRYVPNFQNQKSLLFLSIDNEEFNLSEDAKLILNNNRFYSKAIKEVYDSNAMSKLLAHFMYNDKEFTTKRIYSILENIHSSLNSKDIKETFNLIYNILTLEDDYSIYRFEALIGIPQLQFKFPEEKTLDFRNKLIIKFVSTLFPKQDTLFEKMFKRWKSSPDYINSISYIYAILYKNPSLFRYFNSLPHPRDLCKKLEDYLEEHSKEEIEHIKNHDLKKYDNTVNIVENCIEKYNSKEMEFKEKFNNDNEWNIEFYPKVKLGKIIKEVITNIKIGKVNEDGVFEDPNDKGIYLLRCDMDVVVGDIIICRKFSHQVLIKNEDEGNNKEIEDEKKNEKYENINNDKENITEENKLEENKQEDNEQEEKKLEENQQVYNQQEENKPEENKIEDNQQEENKQEEIKQEENKPEEIKQEEIKQEENKQEEIKQEENKQEENKQEENKQEVIKQDSIPPSNPPVRLNKLNNNEENDDEERKTPTFIQDELRSNLNPNINQNQEKESEINTDSKTTEINKALREDYIATYGQSQGVTLAEKLTSNNENKSVENYQTGIDVYDNKNFYVQLFNKRTNENINKNIGDIDLMIEQKENQLNVNSFPNEPLIRKFHFEENNINNEIIHLRRYLIINTQENNDIRTVIQLNSKFSSFNPYSEIINFTKKSTMSQVITLYLNKKEIGDDDINFNWENFVIEDKQISEQFEIKGIKRSKSDNFKDENLNKNINDIQNGYGYYENDPNYNGGNDGGFEIDCPVCGSKNMISENDTEYKCKNCKSNLLQ